MNKQEMQKRIDKLEFENDQLIAELAFIDQLMRQVGFTDGLQSLKATALELYESGYDEEDLAA